VETFQKARILLDHLLMQCTVLLLIFLGLLRAGQLIAQAERESGEEGLTASKYDTSRTVHITLL
jgi:hypothetical protein